MPDYIKQMINNPDLILFCKNIRSYSIDKAAKMLGADIKDGKLLKIKLYTELTQVPTTEIIYTILNISEISFFNYYIKWWDSTRASGLALGIKVDHNHNISKYFHIKFRSNFPNILYIKKFLFLKYLNIKIESLLKGISYDNNKSKFYLYITDRVDIARVLAYKELDKNININHIEELELYATDTSFKVNIINYFDKAQNTRQSIPIENISCVNILEQLIQSPPIYNGITTDNIYSVYFSLTNKKNIYDLLYNNS